MRILLLSNYPSDYRAYDRNLRSKLHNEMRKELELNHFLYVYRGRKSNEKVSRTEIELPLNWKGFFRKIANVIFIIFKNIKLIKRQRADLIMLEMTNSLYDFPMILYPLLFQNRKFYIETSTPAVNKSKLKRFIIDSLLCLTLKPYKKIGCGNPSTVDKLKIKSSHVIHSRIGFPEYTFVDREFENLSLIYLGTLHNRDIWKTVKGLKIFIDKFPDIKITYDIIGGAKEPEVNLLNQSIKEASLDCFIKYHGYQPTAFVDEILKRCNIGVAFVPITEYFDKVSTTKAIEYLLAGLPVIATRTTFASGILKTDAGVMCDDSPEDFARALEEIYRNRFSYNSKQIRDLYKHYAMSYIIKNEYIPILKSLI